MAAAGCLLAASQAHASPYSDFNIGISLRNSGNCDGAIPRLTAALQAPDLLANLRPIAFLVRGFCEAQLKHDEQAIADYGQAIALEPQRMEAYLERGFAYGRRKEFDAAAADFSMAVRLRPDLPDAYSGLIYLHIAQKKYDDLVADYDKLVALDQNLENAYYDRSEAHALKGDLDAALDDADAIVSLDRHETLGFIARGRVYSHQARFARAEGAFDDALRLEPGNVPALFGKGVAQWSQDNFDDAVATLEALAPLSPKDGYTTLWLAIAHASAHKSNDGLKAWSQTVDRKTWPGPLVGLFAGESSPDAVLQAAQASDEVSRDNNLCEAQFYVAEWHLLRSETAAALPYLHQAAQTCPGNNLERETTSAELKRLKA